MLYLQATFLYYSYLPLLIPTFLCYTYPPILYKGSPQWYNRALKCTILFAHTILFSILSLSAVSTVYPLLILSCFTHHLVLSLLLSLFRTFLLPTAGPPSLPAHAAVQIFFFLLPVQQTLLTPRLISILSREHYAILNSPTPSLSLLLTSDLQALINPPPPPFLPEMQQAGRYSILL